MNIQEMLAERKRLLDEAKAIQKAADDEDRGLTEEEAAQIEANLARAEELAGEIEAVRKAEREAQEREDAIRRRMAEANDWENEVEPPRRTQTPRSQPNLVAGEGASSFRHFGEFMFQVREAAKTPGVGGELERKIQAVSGLHTGIDSEGGFLIPPQFSSEILARMYERGEILSRVRRFTLTGNSLKIPYVNESSRADGSRWGGVRAYWKEEGGTPTATKLDFGQLSLDLKKVMCLGYVTDEQMEDAPATGGLLMDAFSDELLFAVENAVINGTGAGQPLGILNAACLVSVTKETNQTGSTVWGPNVTKMWARCWGRSRRNAVWLNEQSVEPFLWGLALEGRYGSASTSADAIPIYSPAGTVMNQGEYPTLLGRPVIAAEYCKAVGTAGDLLLADLSQYVMADKGSGVEMAVSMHVQFIYAEQCFRAVYRVDGRPWWQAALTPYSAGDTLSPFVAIAARS